MRFNTDRSKRMAFDRVAAQYRARPDVPEALVDWCAERSALPAEARVLEVGAGAGQLTVPLLQSRPQVRVHAVEPGPQLVEVLSDRLSGEARASVECAFFEEVTIDETFHSVWSANAFHWVDPSVAHRRAWDLLVPGGSLVLVWTYLLVDDPDLRRALRADMPGAELVPFLPEHESDLWNHVAESTADGRRELAESGMFELVDWHDHREPLALDAASYAKLVMSYATAAGVDDPPARVAEIRSALDGWGVTSVAFDHRGYGLVARRVER